MNDRRQIIPIAGLLATAAIAVYLVVQLSAQTSALTADLTNAATAEVKDAQGQVVLQGQFTPSEEEDDDIERKAVLKAAVADADAAGQAEVEFDRASPSMQEVEFSVSGVENGAAYTFLIDGREIATATADARGRVEVEVDVKLQAP